MNVQNCSHLDGNNRLQQKNKKYQDKLLKKGFILFTYAIYQMFSHFNI